jgi:hypothetical protein
VTYVMEARTSNAFPGVVIEDGENMSDHQEPDAFYRWRPTSFGLVELIKCEIIASASGVALAPRV